MTAKKTITKHYLLASDFDKTLSFNDSGLILAEMLGINGFEERVDGLSRIHLIQSGGELAYLLLHDPEFRRVRREHLIEVGKRIRLKQNIRLLSQLLRNVDEYSFDFHVISAAPEEVIQSALEGIVPAERIHGTRFRYNDDTGEIGLTFFHPRGDYVEKQLPVGAARYVSGKVEWFNGRPTMIHPTTSWRKTRSTACR